MSSNLEDSKMDETPEDGDLVMDLPEAVETEESEEMKSLEATECEEKRETEEMILPDDPEENQETQDLEKEAKDSQESVETAREPQVDALPAPKKIRRRRKTFSSFNNDGSYASSICASVKTRQRRQSVYYEDEKDNESYEDKKRDLQKKIRLGKDTESARAHAEDDAPVPEKPSRRPKYASDFMDENQDALAEFPQLRMHFLESQQTPSNKSSEDDKEEDEEDTGENIMYCVNEDPPQEVQEVPQLTPQASGSSRRKSTLKPMEAVVKFEKIISYRNPTIPFQSQYKALINVLNRVPNTNDQLMRRLACLKVFHQYFYSEITRSSKLGKALKKSQNTFP
ncbi:probable RNA-binding protein 19 [Lutzomyia longipalpis]|uniref:probable RNA-binding protein 19 n=1 Tax=Lutzomyia longipalpis TaxID=7200 RepID=UPI002483B0EE|nr:probable RNA-binding protein 19 [Lutzomyia longipalpis]